MTLPYDIRNGICYAEIQPASPSGRTFLLLHGLGGSLGFWTAVAPAIGDAARTIVIDVPGFARSAPPPGPTTLDSVAEAIVAFCHEIDVKSCTVVAHSLGGLIGLAVAAKDPDLCERIILVDATPVSAIGLVRHPWRALRVPSLAVTFVAQFLAGIVPLRPRTARLIARSRILRKLALWPFVERPAALDPTVTADALSYTGGVAAVFRVLRQSRSLDLTALLAGAGVPVDLVRGENDRMNTATDFAIVRTHADVRRELVIKQCKHWPLIEAPEVLVDFILAEE
jgi:pimeloyl-ACP methyl ester carboxylesterase